GAVVVEERVLAADREPEWAPVAVPAGQDERPAALDLADLVHGALRGGQAVGARCSSSRFSRGASEAVEPPGIEPGSPRARFGVGAGRNRFRPQTAKARGSPARRPVVPSRAR